MRFQKTLTAGGAHFQKALTAGVVFWLVVHSTCTAVVKNCDTSKIAVATPRIAVTAAAPRIPVAFTPDPKHGASFVLYRGERLNEEDILKKANPDWKLQFYWNDAAHVGMLYSGIAVAHKSLGELIGEEKVIAGTRYSPNDDHTEFPRTNSNTYKEIGGKDVDGPAIQDAYFEMKMMP